MVDSIRYSDNIRVYYPTFKLFVPEYAERAICFVYNRMTNILEISKHKNILIKRSPYEYPKCCPQQDGSHLIYIDSDGDSEYQWIYQLSHELTHAYIDSEYAGEKTGLWWFDEIMCCLASLYYLSEFDSFCGGEPLLARQFPPLPSTQYLESLRHNSHTLGLAIPEDCNLWPYLKQMTAVYDEYDRNQYYYFQAAAFDLLPMFLAKPHLWKIVLHMKSTRNHNSMSSFLEECQHSVDRSWFYDFYELKNHLLRRSTDFVNFTS